MLPGGTALLALAASENSRYSATLRGLTHWLTLGDPLQCAPTLPGTRACCCHLERRVCVGGQLGGLWSGPPLFFVKESVIGADVE